MSQYDQTQLQNARQRLNTASQIAVLTGAGISAESGIPTFRGANGLWKKFRPEELASPSAFRRDPKFVWEWYEWRRELVANTEPNPGHFALAKLERSSDDFTLITQNVDGLHDRAGSKNILKLHGDIWQVRCTSCGKRSRNAVVPLPELPPRCPCGGLLRPDIVWFGESLPQDVLQAARNKSEIADVFLVIGTSALVHPAASLPRVAKESNAYLIEINMEETALSPHADISLFGPAGELLPLLIP